MDENWNIWEENFYDAKAFFESKGNLQTKAKLKSKWYNNFIKNTKQESRPSGSLGDL